MTTELLNKEVLILDGGLGTTLEDKYGVKFNKDMPLWSSHFLITDPDLLERAQQAFVDAGADIILTPTYQASYDGFQKTVINGERVDFFEEICQYLDLAVDISRHSFVNKTGLVALSLGAYGATMIPSQEFGGQYGDMSDETKLENWHCERIAMFSQSFEKVDLVAFETIPRLEELRAVRTAANANRHSAVFKPYWVTCVFPNKDNKLPDGTTIEQILDTLLSDRSWEDEKPLHPPYALGINCTKVQKYHSLLTEFEDVADKLGYKLPKLVIAPNGSNGLVYDSTTQTWVKLEEEEGVWDEEVAKLVAEVRKRGKWGGVIVGGCCKTDPEHIAKLRRRIEGAS